LLHGQFRWPATHATESSQMLTSTQARFLAACREELTVARAARLAGVNRASVCRWLADPTFAAARTAALDEFFKAHREKVLAAEAERAAWRAERERARRPMRRFYLARALAAKRRRAGR
jgi:hypothetical protein